MFWIVLLAFLAPIAVMGGGLFLLTRLQGGSSAAVEFPKIDDSAVLFRETWASGNSLNNTFAVFTNVNNCLAVTVTDQELWIRAPIPMSVLVRLVDMEHRVPLGDVAGVEPSGRKDALVDFVGADGEPRRVKLRLRDRDGFCSVLRDRLPVDGEAELTG